MGDMRKQPQPIGSIKNSEVDSINNMHLVPQLMDVQSEDDGHFTYQELMENDADSNDKRQRIFT